MAAQHGTIMRDISRANVEPALIVVSEPRESTTTKIRPRARRRHLPPKGVTKILFVSANINDHADLALDEEYRAIEQQIRLARHRDAFQLIARPAARRNDLQDALLEHNPHIVHFACHGNVQAETLLRLEGAVSDPVSADSLFSLFEILHDNLILVTFNACFASRQADMIRSSAKATIGMRSSISDRAAIAFASSLYGALAYGRSVREAFNLGVAALDTHQRDIPQLFTPPELDAGKIRLVPTHRPRAWLFATVALATSSALSVVARLPRAAPERTQPRPPVRGMARLAANDVYSGAIDLATWPSECPLPTESPDCNATISPDHFTVVHVSAFELDVMEVTNAELANWLNGTSQHWRTDNYGRILHQPDNVPLALASEECLSALTVTEGRIIAAPDKARWPAVCVTWYGAAEYCRQLGKRLPLAVEWELAAKGTDGRPFPWGAEPPRSDSVTFDLRDGAAPHPRDVGTSRQDVSPEEIRDLGGSVAEWVDGAGSIDTKEIRGGSWASRDPCRLLSSSCKQVPAHGYAADVGFRCASSVIDRALTESEK